jgi:hypothetical protein
VAIVQKNHITIGLVILNYALLLDAMGIIVIGTYVWWSTLQERFNFHQLWLQASSATRIAIQDKVPTLPLISPFESFLQTPFSQLGCCGYFDGSDLAEIGGKFCVSQDFINSLPNNDLDNFCVTPITSIADYTLDAIFT